MRKMENKHYNIVHTCTTKTLLIQELFWEEHSLSIILSGESHNFHNEECFVATAGSIGLIRKNQIFKSLKKNSLDGRPYLSICIRFGQDVLKKYSTENELFAIGSYKGEPWIDLKKNPFLKGFFESLIPYLDQPGKLSENLADLKTREAIELLLSHDPRLKELLFDFNDPFKIDLEAFMTSHFTYKPEFD